MLTTTCNKCESEIKFFSWAEDRVDLAKTKGKYLKLQCKKCNTTEKFHVNKIIATESKLKMFLSGISFLALTITAIIFVWDCAFKLNFLYYSISLLSAIGFPIMIYSVIDSEERKKISLFNRIRISEKLTDNL